jgi:hypothetical protein
LIILKNFLKKKKKKKEIKKERKNKIDVPDMNTRYTRA